MVAYSKCNAPCGLYSYDRSFKQFCGNMLIIIDDDSKKHKKVFKWVHSANYKDFGCHCPTGNCPACSSIDNVSAFGHTMIFRGKEYKC